MRLSRMPIELITLLYLLTYLPYMLITRGLATMPDPGLGKPLSGLQTLPSVLILSLVMLALFVWLSGWWRDAHQSRVGGLSVPVPTVWTFLSGVGTSFLLITVPLSLTFKDVSIPFIQLLMRGDVLVIAPLVDLVARRRVRWYSWVALAMVAAALSLTIWARNGLHLPPLAILAVVLYTVGYFIRLAVMTKVAKNGEDHSLKGYFVEEKMVAMPLTIVVLCAIALSPLARQGAELAWGFKDVWTSTAMPWLALLSVFFFLVTIFSAVILLDRRENSFCVPFERAASILAGSLTAFIMAFAFDQPMPTGSEVLGIVLLIGAIALLSLAPRWGRKQVVAEAA